MRFLLPLLLLPVLAPRPSTDGEESAALARALASVAVENVCADVQFLADDRMQGRDSPSPELDIAARYVRARLQRLGFEPGGRDGSYFAPYQLENAKLDPERCRATLVRGETELGLTFGEDYFFYPQGVGTLDVDARVVFGGAGAGDDLPEGALEGAWAVFQTGNVNWRKRQRNAREAGAIGVVIVPGPDYDGKPFRERYGRLVQRVTRGRVRWPSTPFPFLYLGGPGAELLNDAIAEDATAGRDLGVTLREQRVQAGDGGLVELVNVCGYWPGDVPGLADEVICVSAHLDHVGTRDDDVYNGADDNGSGSTGLLAVAEALAAHGPMRRSVMLIWVTAEEKGLLGSRAWTLDPTLPDGTRAIAALNIDMIGRNAPDYLLITPTSKHEAYNGLTRMAERVAPLEGFPTLGDCDAYWHRSDHANFSKNLEIPVAFLFSDVHDDYHQPSDTFEKIDCDKIARVSRLVVRLLDGLQEDELEL